jgi:hypothetical protein
VAAAPSCRINGIDIRPPQATLRAFGGVFRTRDACRARSRINAQ